MGVITEFAEMYMKNCELGWELDEAIMQEKSFLEWKEILLERSCKIREIFRRMRRALVKLKGYWNPL